MRSSCEHCYQSNGLFIFVLVQIIWAIILLMSTDSSKEYVQNVSIKSKYLNSGEIRSICVSPEKSKISISNSGQPSSFKDFHIEQLQSHKIEGNQVHLQFDNGRKYEIETHEPQKLNQALIHTRNLLMSNKFVDQGINSIPRPINYLQAMSPMLNIFTGVPNMPGNQLRNPGTIPGLIVPRTVGMPTSGVSQKAQQPYPVTTEPRQGQLPAKQKQAREYTCVPYFKNPADWRITEEGNIVILNEDWKSNASKIVGFLVKKFLTTGSFMGLSFPVFAMKPESILQTYAKSIACAPKIFSATFDPIQRMKEFVCFIWTISSLQVTLVKPFNPVIGETFQADIGGGRYSAEQVSHHPPVSAFFFQKDNYKIYASLELSASLGLNSGEGRFLGDVTIQYQDGYWIKGRMPNGQVTGILFGQTYFRPFGGAYVYDCKNLVLSYELGQNSIFEGYLGMLNYKSAKSFATQILKSENRFIQFKAFPKEDYSRILHKFQGKYGHWIAFDGKQIFNFNDHKNFPFELQTPLEREQTLKSDSRNRRDTELLRRGDVDGSQEEKERIENEERDNRKLRAKYNP